MTAEGTPLETETDRLRNVLIPRVTAWFPDDDAPHNKLDELLDDARHAGFKLDITAAMVDEWLETTEERDELQVLVFLLYRTLSDEPIEPLSWLTGDSKALLARVVETLSPNLTPQRATTALTHAHQARDGYRRRAWLAEDERDRLQVVVAAAQRWRQAVDDRPTAPADEPTREADEALDELYEALDAHDTLDAPGQHGQATDG